MDLFHTSYLGTINPIIGTQRKDIANQTQYKGSIDELLLIYSGSNNTGGTFGGSDIELIYNDGHNLINPKGYFGSAYNFYHDYNFNQGSGLPTDEIQNESASTSGEGQEPTFMSSKLISFVISFR